MNAPMTPATCAPPEEHAHHEWHWLRLGDRAPQPKRWSAQYGTWLSFGMSWLTPADLHDRGWRYVAPCVPPPASEGEG